MNFTWLMEFLHSWPHYSLKFRPTSSVFDPWRREYLESMGLWGLAALAVGALLLLLVLISWCVRCCCSRPKEPAKRHQKRPRLSPRLFLASLPRSAFPGPVLLPNLRLNRDRPPPGPSFAVPPHHVPPPSAHVLIH